MAHIKIIDDDIENAENLADVLRQAGYTVSIFGDTKGAVELLAQDRPDLLILDVMFPENPAGGFGLARSLRGRPDTKDLPVILLTNVNQEFPMGFSADDIDADWMPVQDFIEKPVNVEELLEKVSSLLQTSSE